MRFRWLRWVGAYFNPADGGITVIDRDYEDIWGQALLAHEFVHAIQDRDFGFDALTEGVKLEDEFLATRSVIEGDADHSSLAWGAALASAGDAFGVYETDSDALAGWRLRVGPTELDVASIVARALFVGMQQAVAEMKQLVTAAANTYTALRLTIYDFLAVNKRRPRRS